MLRIGEICQRLGCRKSALYVNYIRTGRLKMYPLGTRTVGALEADVERLVGEMVDKGPIDYSRPLHGRGVVRSPRITTQCDTALAVAWLDPATGTWVDF